MPVEAGGSLSQDHGRAPSLLPHDFARASSRQASPQHRSCVFTEFSQETLSNIHSSETSNSMALSFFTVQPHIQWSHVTMDEMAEMALIWRTWAPWVNSRSWWYRSLHAVIHEAKSNRNWLNWNNFVLHLDTSLVSERFSISWPLKCVLLIIFKRPPDPGKAIELLSQGFEETTFQDHWTPSPCICSW